MAHSWNLRRTPRNSPIACRVCDMVFFDNVSLVLHFGCHVKDDNSNPNPSPNHIPIPTPNPSSMLTDRVALPSWQYRGGWQSPSSGLMFRKMNISGVPMVNECCLWPSVTPAAVINPPHVAWVNSALPMIASPSNAEWNVFSLNYYPTMASQTQPTMLPTDYSRRGFSNQFKFTSPSTYPSLYSHFDAGPFGGDKAMAASLEMPRREEGCFSDLGKPSPNIIFIGDGEDENCDKNNAVGIDLTLRL